MARKKSTLNKEGNNPLKGHEDTDNSVVLYKQCISKLIVNLIHINICQNADLLTFL